MVLGQEITVNDNFGGLSPILLPMVICGLGIIFSIIGTFFVTIKDETSSVQTALNMGNWTAMLLTVAASYFVVMWLLPEGQIALRNTTFNKTGVFASIVVGTIVGAIMLMPQAVPAISGYAHPRDAAFCIYLTGHVSV